jgi:hypothetical protein
MSCIFCDHSVPTNWPIKRRTSYLFGSEYTEEDRNRATVQCTLNPVWLTVSTIHFCSRDTTQQDVASNNAMRMDRETAWQEAREQRLRAIEAEKKLKALRKKVRDGK